MLEKIENSEKMLHEQEQPLLIIGSSERAYSKILIYQKVMLSAMYKYRSHLINETKTEKMALKTYQLDSQVIRSVSEQTSVNLWRN